MIHSAVHSAVLIGAFLIFWFLAFIMLLPVGLGAHDPATGAPENPRILRKAGIATAIAVVLWVIFYALIALGVLQL